jgi:hypothetical protein
MGAFVHEFRVKSLIDDLIRGLSPAGALFLYVAVCAPLYIILHQKCCRPVCTDAASSTSNFWCES